jgi:hypothetical protein
LPLSAIRSAIEIWFLGGVVAFEDCVAGSFQGTGGRMMDWLMEKFKKELVEEAKKIDACLGGNELSWPEHLIRALFVRRLNITDEELQAIHDAAIEQPSVPIR